MRKGANWGMFVFFFSLLFLGLIFYGIKTCERKAEQAQKEIQRAGEQVVRKIGQVGEEIKEQAEKIPKRIIGDFNISFEPLCNRIDGVVCDGEKSEFCASGDQIEIDGFLGHRGQLHCCKSACVSTPPRTLAGYPLKYIGGNVLLTCAFQKAEDCRMDKYCENEQWVSSRDSKTCCKSVCKGRIQHKDVFFEGLGYATIERFAGNRFGVWYGTGVGEGFYELGKPNYAEARLVVDAEYAFTVEQRTFSFFLLQNAPATIKVSTGKVPVALDNDIRIKNMVYNPATKEVAANATIVWVNDDATPHTVTFDKGVDSGSIVPGSRFSFTPEAAGEYSYHCNIHPTMKGVIRVG